MSWIGYLVPILLGIIALMLLGLDRRDAHNQIVLYRFLDNWYQEWRLLNEDKLAEKRRKNERE